MFESDVYFEWQTKNQRNIWQNRICPTHTRRERKEERERITEREKVALLKEFYRDRLKRELDTDKDATSQKNESEPENYNTLPKLV
jgi:Golgi nucleoside diphosphatase